MASSRSPEGGGLRFMLHVDDPNSHMARSRILIIVTSVRPVISIVFVDRSVSDSGAVVGDCRCSLFDGFIFNIFIV